MTGRTDEELARDYEALYRDYVDLLKQVEHLSTLREIGLAISSTLEMDQMLTTIADVVQGTLDVARLTIYDVDRRNQVARPLIAKFGHDPISKERLQEEAVSLREAHMAEAIRTRRVVIVNDDLRCEAYVPLQARNTVVGVLRLEDRRDGQPFSEDDASLFQSMGAQIAVALNNAHLYALAVSDGLTGLYVRRYFDLRMDEEFGQAQRYRRAFSLILLDIDHFKQLNDTYGHQTGDRVLQQFAALLRAHTRRTDISCRYGGEELAVILPETRLDQAAVLADKLRDLIADTPFLGAYNETLAVTASMGVAEFRETQKWPADMLRAADEALYRAKHEGRNRVCLAR